MGELLVGLLCYVETTLAIHSHTPGAKPTKPELSVLLSLVLNRHTLLTLASSGMKLCAEKTGNGLGPDWKGVANGMGTRHEGSFP